MVHRPKTNRVGKRQPKSELLTTAVVRRPRLVVLGDPGSGKSTLVSWLAWQLARRKDTPWIPYLNGLVPIPIVLRELGIVPGIAWEGLLAAFLEHEMAEPIAKDRNLFNRMLASGQAYLLLDGLDEIGSLEARRSLRDAAFEGMDRFPACRWIRTSRIVGYEEVTFHHVDGAIARTDTPSWSSLDEWDMRRWLAIFPPNRPDAPRASRRIPQLAYVAPFNDEQIRRYVRNWFAQRDIVAERAAAHGEEFIRALYSHETISRLARTPYILTLMALIYRIKAKLPHGRALLYHQIAEAYLQAIDEYRKLRELGYTLAQKRRWLARVAFEMQLRRIVHASRLNKRSQTQTARSDAEILVNQEQVTDWIARSMGESGYGHNEKAAAEFVDHIARRSGLLLPRGPGQLAFAHLSFQEYFTACYLAEQLRSPLWPRTGRTPDPRVHQGLRGYAGDVLWHETLIFLFEIVADEPGWSEAISEALLGEGFSTVEGRGKKAMASAVLLAHLGVDPHSGFNATMRSQAVERCWRIELAVQGKLKELDFWEYEPLVAQALLTALPTERLVVWNAFYAAGAEAMRQLNLNSTPVSDLAPLSKLTALQKLDLSYTTVNDLTPLAKLTALQSLRLNETRVSDLTPLASLTALEMLSLGGTLVSDLTPLANLTAIEAVVLGGTPVSDLTPLTKLPALDSLVLNGTMVRNLSPLVALPKLKFLWVEDSQVTELEVQQFHEARRAAGLSEVEINPDVNT